MSAKRSKKSIQKKVLIGSRDWRLAPLSLTPSLQRVARLSAKGVLPQVLLIYGEAGAGKSLLAAAIAGSFYCEESRSCGNCGGCQNVLQDQEEDLLWLETSESVLKLQEAHALIEHVSMNPMTSSSSKLGARMGVIIDVDKLNDAAANCLLKTLEEPSPQTRIIMTTSRIKAILPTILSRAVRWHLAGIAPLSMESGPAAISKEERSLFWRLFEGSEDTVDVAEALIKNYGYSAEELLIKAEVSLNAYYRDLALRGASTSSAVIRRRRESLRAIRELALKRKISLNAQFSAEGLGAL